MYSNEYLAHYGIKKQKWGQRRYQNPDGSLTEEGRIRYGVGKGRLGVSENTKEKSRLGAKVGAAVGLADGVVGGAVTNAAFILAGASPSVALGIGAAYLTGTIINGTLLGASLGAINGAAETAYGRKIMDEHGQDYKNIKMSELHK